MALTKVTEKIITDNLSISGIASASNFKTGTTDVHNVGVTAGSLIVGSAVTCNSDGIEVTGIVTATSFVGSGANLTGIDATSIKHTDGNVKIQAINTGANVTGNLSVSGNLGIAGVLTYEDVTNVDSIGIVTARAGINLVGNDLNIGSSIKIGNASGIVTATTFVGALTGNSTGLSGTPNISVGTINCSSGTFTGDILVNNSSGVSLLQLQDNTNNALHEFGTPGNGDLRITVDKNDVASGQEFQLYMRGNNNDDLAFHIDHDKNVMIGASSWQYKKPLNVQGSTGSIISIFNGDTTTYAANTNSAIEFKLKTGSSTNQVTACEMRGFKENGTDGNSARGLNFWTGESAASPAERLRITSFGDVYATNSTYNSFDTAATSVETITTAHENRSGVYWLEFNGVKFRAYVKPNWLQGRNWVLAAKYFDPQDMPSGSSLWTNDTYVNESDFNLYGGIMSKYRSWRYFSFNRLAMQMGNRIPPIMQFNSNQTLFGAFSGGRASNGGGVTANSTDPAMSGTGMTYHSFDCYAGPDFHDVLGSEDRLGSYGLNKWANNAANSTSASNIGSVAINNQHWDEVAVSSGPASSAPANNDFAMSTNHGLDYRSLKGFRFTMEDSCNLSGLDSNGYAGAWIGCPLDEGNSTQGSDSSNVGADSGFGIGGSAGNNARTWTSGYAEWGQGNYVVNCLPAYIWLSID